MFTCWSSGVQMPHVIWLSRLISEDQCLCPLTEPTSTKPSRYAMSAWVPSCDQVKSLTWKRETPSTAIANEQNLHRLVSVVTETGLVTWAPLSFTSSTDHLPSYWIQTKIPPSISQVASFWKGSFQRTKTTYKSPPHWHKPDRGANVSNRHIGCFFSGYLAIYLFILASCFSWFNLADYG